MNDQDKVIDSLNKFANEERPSWLSTADIQSALTDTELDTSVFKEILNTLESQDLLKLNYANGKLKRISLNRDFPK